MKKERIYLGKRVPDYGICYVGYLYGTRVSSLAIKLSGKSYEKAKRCQLLQDRNGLYYAEGKTSGYFYAY